VKDEHVRGVTQEDVAEDAAEGVAQDLAFVCPPTGNPNQLLLFGFLPTHLVLSA